MEEFILKSFGSFALFLIELQVLCDKIFLCVVKKSGSKLKIIDPFWKSFEYEYVRFECLHFVKPNQIKAYNSRSNQKTNKIDCEFYFRLKFNEAENCMKITSFNLFTIIL